LTHPTQPEASSRGDATALRRAMQAMLEEWNAALARLGQAVRHPDAEREIVPYGPELRPSELVEIPKRDLPPGTPPWMRSPAPWAERRGETAEERRSTIAITVPEAARPWLS
jgi:hypothetical protein